MPPIYDFHCTACEHEFESLMRPYDPVECPACKARSVDKKPAVCAGHIWKCNPEGAEPKKHWAGKESKREK